jgi:hypothetical protein
MALNLRQQVTYDIWNKVFANVGNEHYQTICNILDKLDIFDLLGILPKEHRKKFEGYVINSDVMDK